MGAFIVKQPNGLYCRFSTVMDCPTHYNMTVQDYIKLCEEQARAEALLTLEHHLRPFEQIGKYFVPNNMTEAEFEKLMAEMSEPVA